MEVENRDHILSAIKYLPLRKLTPTRTEFLNKWEKDEQLLDSVLSELVSDGLVILSDGVYSFTAEGRKLAQQNDARDFGRWMITSEQSAAYREMCREIYGSDRCQFNMVTQNQLGKLLDALNISACTSILDLGCGTGALTEYIAGHAGGRVTGIDFSAGAVEFARERTSKKQDQLSFQVMDMDEISFPANSFDAVLSFDTLYFVNDLDETINAMLGTLQKHGQMGIFYSAKVYPGESKGKLRPENTVLAEALERCGMQYETWDFTVEEKEFWEKSLAIANQLKDQFDEEGNLKLYESRINESTRELEFFDAQGKSRYLYRAWL